MADGKTEVKSQFNCWGSQEREARAHARFSEFCNDLAAAFMTVGDLDTALAQARRAIKTIEIALAPAVGEESFVWAQLPYDSGEKIKKADKLLRPLAQQLEVSTMTPQELSFAIHEAIAEIQIHTESWEETDLKGI